MINNIEYLKKKNFLDMEVGEVFAYINKNERNFWIICEKINETDLLILECNRKNYYEDIGKVFELGGLGYVFDEKGNRGEGSALFYDTIFEHHKNCYELTKESQNLYKEE